MQIEYISIDPGKLQGIGEVKCMQYFNILLEKLSSCNIISWLLQDTLDLGAKGWENGLGAV